VKSCPEDVFRMVKRKEVGVVAFLLTACSPWTFELAASRRYVTVKDDSSLVPVVVGPKGFGLQELKLKFLYRDLAEDVIISARRPIFAGRES